MGWAKYMEDDLEIIENRNAFGYYEIYSMSYPSRQPAPHIRKEPVGRTLDVNMTTAFRDTYKNEFIICKECGKMFSFSAESQRMYSNRGWNPPKRCKCCRNRRNISYLMRTAC